MKNSLALTSCVLALSVQAAYANQTTEAPNEAKLEKQVITATTTSHNQITAPASVSVVTADDLLAQNHSTIAQALEETVGVSLQNGAYGRQDIRIRGMESKYALVLINGKRTNSSNMLVRGNDFDLSGFPMSSVERIEVIRGPMSSLYGSDALGGVINIITKQALTTNQEVSANSLTTKSAKQTFNAGIETEITQQKEGKGGDTQRISGYANGTLIPNLLSGSLSLETTDRDAWKPNEGALADVDGLEKSYKEAVKGNIDVRLGQNQNLSLDLAYSKDDREADWLGGPAVQTNIQQTERFVSNVQFNGQFGDIQQQASLQVEKVDITDQSTLYAIDTRTNNGTSNAEQINYVLDTLTNTEVNGNLISAGIQIRNTELTSDRDLPNGDKITEVALFAQDEIFVNGIALTAGLRAENHEDYGTHVSPRAYAVYETDNGVVVKGGVGTGFNAPDLVYVSEEFNLISCQGACYITGNPDLKPETNTAYELSVAFEDKGFGVSGGVFYNEVKDKLNRDATTIVGSFNGAPTIQFVNIDKATYEGVELDAWFNITNQINLTANYTYTDARDTSTDTRLTLVPLQQSNLKLDFNPTEAINTFAKYRFIGTQELNTGSAPSYDIIDLGAQYKTYNGIKVKAGINNIENVVLADESPAFATGTSYVEQGRSFYVGLGYDF